MGQSIVSSNEPSPAAPSADLGSLFALANLATMTESQRASATSHESSRANSPLVPPCAGNAEADLQQHKPEKKKQQQQQKRRPAKKRAVPSDMEMASGESGNEAATTAAADVTIATADDAPASTTASSLPEKSLSTSSSLPVEKSSKKNVKSSPRSSSAKANNTGNESSKRAKKTKKAGGAADGNTVDNNSTTESSSNTVTVEKSIADNNDDNAKSTEVGKKLKKPSSAKSPSKSKKSKSSSAKQPKPQKPDKQVKLQKQPKESKPSPPKASSAKNSSSSNNDNDSANSNDCKTSNKTKPPQTHRHNLEPKPTFPVILLAILSSPNNGEIISFLSDNQSFIVVNPRALEREVLPVHFGKDVIGPVKMKTAKTSSSVKNSKHAKTGDCSNSSHDANVNNNVDNTSANNNDCEGPVKTFDEFKHRLSRWGFQLKSDPKYPKVNVWKHDMFCKGEWEACLSIRLEDKTSQEQNDVPVGAVDGATNVDQKSINNYPSQHYRNNSSEYHRPPTPINNHANDMEEQEEHPQQDQQPRSPHTHHARSVTPSADSTEGGNGEARRISNASQSGFGGSSHQFDSASQHQPHLPLASTNKFDAAQLEAVKNVLLLQGIQGMQGVQGFVHGVATRRHSDLMLSAMQNMNAMTSIKGNTASSNSNSNNNDGNNDSSPMMGPSTDAIAIAAAMSSSSSNGATSMEESQMLQPLLHERMECQMLMQQQQQQDRSSLQQHSSLYSNMRSSLRSGYTHHSHPAAASLARRASLLATGGLGLGSSGGSLLTSSSSLGLGEPSMSRRYSSLGAVGGGYSDSISSRMSLPFNASSRWNAGGGSTSSPLSCSLQQPSASSFSSREMQDLLLSRMHSNSRGASKTTSMMTDDEVKTATEDVVSAAIDALRRGDMAQQGVAVPSIAHSMSSHMPKRSRRHTLDHIPLHHSISISTTAKASAVAAVPSSSPLTSRLDVMTEHFLEQSRARLSCRPMGIGGLSSSSAASSSTLSPPTTDATTTIAASKNNGITSSSYFSTHGGVYSGGVGSKLNISSRDSLMAAVGAEVDAQARVILAQRRASLSGV